MPMTQLDIFFNGSKHPFVAANDVTWIIRRHWIQLKTIAMVLKTWQWRLPQPEPPSGLPGAWRPLHFGKALRFQ
jgi:hypothetical protein